MRTYFIKVPGTIQNLYPSATWKQDPELGICWTIDDGPHPLSTPDWLNLLDELKITATFFLIGENCLKYPSLVTEIRSAGHIIGGHGYHHLDGWKTSTADYLQDIQKCQDILGTGLFRPPYGRLTYPQYMVIKKTSNIMMWTIMPGDFDPNVSAERLIERSEMIKEGDIVVLHDQPNSYRKAAQMVRHVQEKALYRINAGTSLSVLSSIKYIL